MYSNPNQRIGQRQSGLCYPYDLRANSTVSVSATETWVPPCIAGKTLMVLVMLVMTLSTTACVYMSHKPYPKEWPPLTAVREGECPDLSGQFCLDDAADTKSCTEGCLRMPLTEAVFSWVDADTISETGTSVPRTSAKARPSRVELRGPSSNRLSVIAVDETGVQTQRLLELVPDSSWNVHGPLGGEERILGFTCSARGLPMRKRIFSFFFFLAPAWAYNTRTFQRAENGDIVMREASSGFGYAFLIPLFVNRVDWHRWPAIPENARTERPPNSR
ncbi:hypothetical protein ACW73L_21940 [Methylolobus aquaticus]